MFTSKATGQKTSIPLPEWQTIKKEHLKRGLKRAYSKQILYRLSLEEQSEEEEEGSRRSARWRD